MKTMKEIEVETPETLRMLAADLEREIYQLKCELQMAKKLEKPHELLHKKKERARVLTALNKKLKLA